MKTTGITIACALGILPGLSAQGGGGAGMGVFIGDLPAGKSIIISHSVVVNGTTTAAWITSQGTVLGGNFTSLLTDDPAVGGGADPTVTGVQQPPTLANISQGATEDTPESFAAADFDAGFSDPNGGDALQVLRITSLPSKGTLKLGAADILATPVDILRANIGTLIYSPADDEFGADSFGWNASDGVELAAAGVLVNLTIAAVNDGPDADPDTVDRFPTQSVQIPMASLLLGDTDPEGDLPLALTGVNYTGGNGVSVTLRGDTVFYNPNSYTGADTFVYIVEDSLGASSTGTVTVALITDDSQLANATFIEALPGGAVEVTFAAVPGRTYRIQSSDATMPPSWIDRQNSVADAQGKVVYTDPAVVPPQRIYRTEHP